MAASAPSLFDDDALLDDNGDLKSGQPLPSSSGKSPKSSVQPVAKLSRENFRLVRYQSDRVRQIMINRDKAKAFLDYNIRLHQQEIRPKWMPAPPCLPLLPGSTPFPHALHEDWRTTTSKYERKLHKKVIKHLPNVIDCMEEKIHIERESRLQNVKENISDPSQKRRAELLFLRFVNQTEQPSPFHARRPRQSWGEQSRRPSL